MCREYPVIQNKITFYGSNQMEKPSKEKKVGFLGYLMRAFIVFVVIILLATGFFYLKKKTVTVYALNFYSGQLSTALASEKHYQLSEDEEYKIEYEGKKGGAGFDEAQIKDKILKQRTKDAHEALKKLVENYRQDDTKKWQQIFSDLRQEINNIFTDKKIFPEEYQSFLSKLEAYSK